MGNNPSHFQGDNLPVEQVSWEDAQEFCRKLSQKTGKKYRLPTEAEWEYAARAGTTGDYAGDINSMGWHRDNSGDRTHAVGNKAPNAWGLYDMHGDVWEWCQDWYEKYKADPVKDPVGPSQGSLKVFRGGSWNFEEPFCRSADRNWSTPDLRFYDLGFRLARN